MKIKDFDEKVRIGSQVVFEGKIRQVVDIIRKTHEAILGKAAIVVRCSEFELYTGGEVQPYVEENDPPVKLGRPGKPVIAILKNGDEHEFESINKASLALNVSRYSINMVLYGRAKYVKGIHFQR